MSQALRVGAALLAVALVASALSGGAAGAQSDVTITVTVVGPDGEPISGVELIATWDGGETTQTTRSNGQALLDVPEGADVTVETAHDDYVRNEPFVIEDAAAGSAEIEMVPAGSLTVTVERDGEPVPNAVVRLFSDGDAVANDRTDADGQFATGQIEQGEYRLVAFKEGYRRTEETVAVDGDVSRTVSIERGSVPVTFVVTDGGDPPQPVEGATVRVADIGEATTLGDGEATLRVPVNDEFEVTVVGDDETVNETVRVGESETTVNLTLAPAAGGAAPNGTAAADSPTPAGDGGLGFNATVAVIAVAAIAGLLALLALTRRRRA